MVKGRDVAVLAGTLLLWLTTMSLAARSVGWAPLLTPTWGRWDTGQYLSIARNGYIFEQCVGVANRGPDDWCGNSGWFPLYPYMMRVGSWSGLGDDTVGAGDLTRLDGDGLVGAVVRFLRRRSIVAGVLGMVIARGVPGERLLRRDLPRVDDARRGDPCADVSRSSAVAAGRAVRCGCRARVSVGVPRRHDGGRPTHRGDAR